MLSAGENPTKLFPDHIGKTFKSYNADDEDDRHSEHR